MASDFGQNDSGPSSGPGTPWNGALVVVHPPVARAGAAFFSVPSAGTDPMQGFPVSTFNWWAVAWNSHPWSTFISKQLSLSNGQLVYPFLTIYSNEPTINWPLSTINWPLASQQLTSINHDQTSININQPSVNYWSTIVNHQCHQWTISQPTRFMNQQLVNKGVHNLQPEPMRSSTDRSQHQ